eukprot:3491697-Lingulodinium_polyedra.AAC.1
MPDQQLHIYNMVVSTDESFWAAQSDAWVSTIIGQGLVIFAAPGPAVLSTAFYLSLGSMSNMALLGLPLQASGTAADSLVLTLPPFHEKQEEPLKILNITDLEAWQAADVEWAGPAAAHLSATTASSSSSSASAAPHCAKPLTVRGLYKNRMLVTKAMAL